MQKEPKNQGGESLNGGLFIDAAPFEWSIKFIDRNQRTGRYQMLPSVAENTLFPSTDSRPEKSISKTFYFLRKGES